MLNRRHIRVKVMQTIYAFKGSESDDFSKDQKFLLFSVDNMYNLYLLLIALLIEVQKRAEADLQKKQKKHLATQEDKDPNRKFVDNALFALLKNNINLQNKFEAYSITNWNLDSEYVELIFKEILASDLYKAYMQTRVSTFKEDKDFIVAVFKDLIAPNDKLYDYMEDKNLTWLDDLPTVNTAILKLLRKAKVTSDESHFTPRLYKDSDDKQFAIDLFRKTLLKSSVIKKAIADKTKNWETDRIATVDYVLLQMAICELNNFPSIPAKVTINEYLEISKEYSTPKSSIFINGILDKLVKEHEAAGTLNKIGRGLM